MTGIEEQLTRKICSYLKSYSDPMSKFCAHVPNYDDSILGEKTQL